SAQGYQQLVSLPCPPEHGPCGNPIPAADGTVISTREGSRALADVLEAEPVSVQITRIGEPLQVDVELLAALQQAGITPGTTVRFHRGSDAISAQVEGSEEALDLPPEIARHLFVARN